MRGSFLVMLALVALSAAPAAAASGKLVLYTSQPNEDAQATVDAFKQHHPDVDVEWIRDGTTRVMAKLRAEQAAGAPQADVLLIADTVTMEALKQEGLLLAYPEAPTDAYPAGLHDPDGQYFSTKLITTGIVYNNDAPLQPTSWHDLTAAEAKDLVTMPSPLTSGAAAIHIAAPDGQSRVRLGVFRGARGQRPGAAGATARSSRRWPRARSCTASSSTTCRSARRPRARQ